MGEKLFVVSMDVASAFDSVSAQVLGDVLLERGATTISAAAAVRENLELCARPCMGFTESPPFNLDVGMRQGGPRTPSGWNQVMAVLIEELSLLWAGRALAVSWAPEWKPFEILVWADNTFLVSSSIIDIVQRTQDIEHVFGKRDLRFNQKSLEILPSKTAEKEATRVWLNEKMEFSCVPVLVVLGCHWMHLDQQRHKFRGVWNRGGKCLAKCVRCCVARGFRRKNASEHSTHGCFMCLVGFGLLDSDDKNSAARIIPGKQVASLHAGRSEIVKGIYLAPDIHEHFTIHKGYGILRISSRTTSTILSTL